MSLSMPSIAARAATRQNHGNPGHQAVNPRAASESRSARRPTNSTQPEPLHNPWAEYVHEIQRNPGAWIQNPDFETGLAPFDYASYEGSDGVRVPPPAYEPMTIEVWETLLQTHAWDLSFGLGGCVPSATVSDSRRPDAHRESPHRRLPAEWILEVEGEVDRDERLPTYEEVDRDKTPKYKSRRRWKVEQEKKARPREILNDIAKCEMMLAEYTSEGPLTGASVRLVRELVERAQKLLARLEIEQHERWEYSTRDYA